MNIKWLYLLLLVSTPLLCTASGHGPDLRPLFAFLVIAAIILTINIIALIRGLVTKGTKVLWTALAINVGCLLFYIAHDFRTKYQLSRYEKKYGMSDGPMEYSWNAIFLFVALILINLMIILNKRQSKNQYINHVFVFIFMVLALLFYEIRYSWYY